MVDSVGPIKGGVTGVQRATAVSAPKSTRTSEMARAAAANAVPNPAADLAAWGPPVDEAKIQALRAAIVDGSYKADPDQIAAKMIAADLPAPVAPKGKPAK